MNEQEQKVYDAWKAGTAKHSAGAFVSVKVGDVRTLLGVIEKFAPKFTPPPPETPDA